MSLKDLGTQLDFWLFHKFSLSFGCLLLRLVLAVFGISYAWMFFSGFSATSTPRRDFDKTFITGHRGRWRPCIVLQTTSVERMTSSLTTLARRTLLEESVLIMSFNSWRCCSPECKCYEDKDFLRPFWLISRAWLVQLCHFMVWYFLFWHWFQIIQHQHCPDMKRKGY